VALVWAKLEQPRPLYCSNKMESLFDVSFDPGKVVALIPTLMSIVGSVNIARLVKRSPSFHHGAKRILMGMSLCEVISAIAFSMHSLFIPRATSHFLWAIGNGSALGLLMQFSISSYVFSCFVSFIYLSKISFGGGANRDFCRTRIEPWTGALGGFGYPLLTAVLGLAMRYYSQQDFLPSDTDESSVSRRQQELSARVGQFLFPGYPITNLLAAIAVNSFVIFAFVRGTTSSSNSGGGGAKSDRDALLRSRTNGVATASVLLTYGWTAILKVFESNDISHFSKNQLGPLLWLQLVLLPALALANGITWLQPRMARIQALYPCESTPWCIARALLGKSVKPSNLMSTRTSDSLSSVSHSFDFASRRRCRF
jgi:hypothetical protein